MRVGGQPATVMVGSIKTRLVVKLAAIKVGRQLATAKACGQLATAKVGGQLATAKVGGQLLDIISSGKFLRVETNLFFCTRSAKQNFEKPFSCF